MWERLVFNWCLQWFNLYPLFSLRCMEDNTMVKYSAASPMEEHYSIKAFKFKDNLPNNIDTTVVFIQVIIFLPVLPNVLQGNYSTDLFCDVDTQCKITYLSVDFTNRLQAYSISIYSTRFEKGCCLCLQTTKIDP